MLKIVLIVQNPKELVLLRQLFLKVKAKVISAIPTYASYIKTLQYDPDIVILEIPEDPKAHLQFVRLIRGNKAIDQKPFILYGPQFDQENVKKICDAGADIFIARPLDVKALITNIRELIKSASKDSKYQIEEKNQLSEDDRGKLFDPTVSCSEKKDIMRRHIGNLLAFPATVASILRVSQSEKSGAAELAKVIGADPAMAAEILKIANSVYFSRGGRRIISIKDAVVRIGFIQTKKIAMSLTVFEVSKDQNYATGFNHNEYWFHCLAVAILSETIAKCSGLVSQEEAFIAGLLHDLGTLLFNEYFNEIFLKVIEKATNEGIRFVECERELLGFDHNDLMSELFTEWKYPELLCNDIRFICRSVDLTRQFMSEHKLAGIVNIADIIAKSFQIGRGADCCIESVSREIMEFIRYPYGIQPAFLEKVYNELNLYNQILNIEKRTFPVICDQIKDASEIKLICYSFKDENFIPVYNYLKTQGYQIELVRTIQELNEKVSLVHAAILTGVDSTAEEYISQLTGVKMIPFIKKGDTPSGQNKDDSGGLGTTSAKLLLFGSDDSYLAQKKSKNVVTSMHTFDLRTVDIALHCLLANLSTDDLCNDKGTLRLQKAADSLNILFSKRKVLIGNSKTDARAKIKAYFEDSEKYTIEETNEGPKVVNLAKTMTSELDLLIVDLEIPFQSSVEVIKNIKMMPLHRQTRIIITFKNAEKEQLVPFVKMGVRDFINEEASSQELARKFQGMGL